MPVAAALVGLAGAVAAVAAAGQPSDRAFQPGEEVLDAGMSAAYRSCVERSGGITADMRNCADAEYRRLDAALNRTYQQTMRRLPRSRARQLQAEQRAWLAGKAGTCRAYVQENEEGGGTMDLLLMDACGLRELLRRTRWLARYR